MSQTKARKKPVKRKARVTKKSMTPLTPPIVKGKKIGRKINGPQWNPVAAARQKAADIGRFDRTRSRTPSRNNKLARKTGKRIMIDLDPNTRKNSHTLGFDQSMGSINYFGGPSEPPSRRSSVESPTSVSSGPAVGFGPPVMGRLLHKRRSDNSSNSNMNGGKSKMNGGKSKKRRSSVKKCKTKKCKGCKNCKSPRSRRGGAARR
tara:strand:- start:262 stop:876 length:615 start_codon:yes stop_codon:yes gene_type:complete